jgi:hypothetical protein
MENPTYLYKQGFLDPNLTKWIMECKQRYSDWFSLAVRVNEIAMDVLHKLEAHNRLVHEMLLASLYLRTLHNYQGMILMAERGMISQGRILVRAMLDSMFPLVAIAKDHSFAPIYARNHQLQLVKYVEKVQKLTSTRIPELELPEAQSRITELRNEIKKFGIKEIKTEELADKAGLKDWYLTAYAQLSGTVHSRAGDLEEYLVLTSEQEIKELDWGPRVKGLELKLATAMDAMLLSIEHVQAISQDIFTERREALRIALTELGKRADVVA